jgi:hypothetical protein
MFCKPSSLMSGFAAGLLVASVAFAQQQSETYQAGSFNPPYNGGGGYYGGGGGWGGWGWGSNMGVGSTAAGSYYTGLGNAIRSQGQFNLDTSAAAINLTEAQRREIENSKLWTETYFEKRRINQAYRESQRRPAGNSETWMRLAQVGVPSRLSPSVLDPVTGRITWPAGLSDPPFKNDRDALDRLFADRALAHGAIGPQTHDQISQTVNRMLATLKSLIKKYPTSLYVESRSFLNSLAYEASVPNPGFEPTAGITPPSPR